MTVIRTGPSPADLEVYAGDKNEITVRFQKGGDPWDITGATLASQARVSAVDDAVALTAVTAIVDGANGTATVAWDGEAVRTLLAGADRWIGVWDLQVLETGETLPTTVLRGSFTAVMDVTRVGV